MSDEELKRLKERAELLNRHSETLEDKNQELEAKLKEQEERHLAEIEAASSRMGQIEQRLKEQARNSLLANVKAKLPDLSEDQLQSLEGETAEELVKSGEALLAKAKEQEAEVLKKYGLDPEKVSQQAEVKPMNLNPASGAVPAVSPEREIDARIAEVVAWKDTGPDGRATRQSYDGALHIGLKMEKNKLAANSR